MKRRPLRRWAVQTPDGTIEWDGQASRQWKAWSVAGVLLYHGQDPGAAMDELLARGLSDPG